MSLQKAIGDFTEFTESLIPAFNAGDMCNFLTIDSQPSLSPSRDINLKFPVAGCCDESLDGRASAQSETLIRFPVESA